MIAKARQRFQTIYEDYPRSFWTVTVVVFVDRLSGSLLVPFFALYMTNRFNVGMETVGALFAMWMAASSIGSFVSGTLSDRFGRKWMIIIGLVATGLSNLGLGLANSLTMFFVFGFLAGIFSDVADPAYQAVVADLLPDQKRAAAYGIVLVVHNLASALGPAIGGFIAERSYLILFILGAVFAVIAAVMVFFIIPETKPATQVQESTSESFGGYLQIFRNKAFMVFTIISTLLWLAYVNIGTTLGVYLRNSHGIAETGYGWLLSMNAVLIVLFQFPISRRLEKQQPMRMMAAGAAALTLGFVMYGLFSSYPLFVMAIMIISFGQIVMLPVSNALVARFAPESMRGRYIFIYNLSWGFAYFAGPYLAGLIMDNFDPRWLWYSCAILTAFAMLGFLFSQDSSRRIKPLAESKPV